MTWRVSQWILLLILIWLIPTPVTAISEGKGQKQRFSCDKVDFNFQTSFEPRYILPKDERTCSVPVGLSTVTNPTTPITWEYARQIETVQDLQQGDNCTGRYRAGPTFVKQNDRDWNVWWKDPDNVVHTSVASDEGISDAWHQVKDLSQAAWPKLLQWTGPFVGFNLVQVPMVIRGNWRIENGKGQCAGTWKPNKEAMRRPEGGTDYPDYDPEVVLTPYVPDPPGGPMAVVPREAIRRMLLDPGAVSPGQIAVAPRADRGLVNLNQHAWIEGATVQGQSVWKMVATSGPDGTGRALRYQYYVTVGLSGVEWKWGDGSGTDWWPDLGEQGPNGHNPTHKYRTISAKAGTGPPVNGVASYLAEAVEHYTVDVVAVWFDGRATRRQNLGDLGLGFDQSPAARGIYVGQVEGVPSS